MKSEAASLITQADLRIGTLAASEMKYRVADVGRERVCKSSIKTTDTMASRLDRGWLEEGEDLQLILI